MPAIEQDLKPVELLHTCPHCGEHRLSRVSNALLRCETCAVTFPMGSPVRDHRDRE